MNGMYTLHRAIRVGEAMNITFTSPPSVPFSRKFEGTITEKSAVAFELGGDNLKQYFDQK